MTTFWKDGRHTFYGLVLCLHACHFRTLQGGSHTRSDNQKQWMVRMFRLFGGVYFFIYFCDWPTDSSDLTMKFYWHQLCFIAFSALMTTVPIDDTNWFHCHTLAIPSLWLIAAFPKALSVFGYSILYTLNQKNSASGTIRIVRGRKMVFSRPARGEMVPTSSWAAILPVLPQRESQLCVCPEDLLAVALSVDLPCNAPHTLDCRSHYIFCVI